MHKLNYKMIQFPGSTGVRFVGVLWNYDVAILQSTRDYETYTEARDELARLADEVQGELRYFDGEYVYDSASGMLLDLP